VTPQPLRVRKIGDPLLQRRREALLAAAALLGLAGCGHIAVRPPRRAIGGVPPFSAPRVDGGLPEGWVPQVPRPDLRRTVYDVVTSDRRRVLHATADDAASGLRCDVDIDPVATPWLEWSWRTRGVDDAATVAVDDHDDSPARVAVGFDGDFSTLTARERLFGDLVYAITGYPMPFATLMYVWEGQAPLESVFAYPRTSRIRYLVVESGPARAGSWIAYRRNVADDYRRVFGGAPGRVRDLGVLSDSDDLHAHFETWYGDIAFRADGSPSGAD
jgi:hypothetical protein